MDVVASVVSRNVPKSSRKRVITKNEFKRVLLAYVSRVPCTAETCKLEKRELSSVIETLQEENQAKEAVIKKLRRNLSVMQLAIKEFSCYFTSNFAGTKIAAAARKWEQKWKLKDEEVLRNRTHLEKTFAETPHGHSPAKPSSSSVLSTSPTSSFAYHPKLPAAANLQLVSRQQNNTLHQVAQMATVSRSLKSVRNQMRENSQELIRRSFTSTNCSETSKAETAKNQALITINQPLTAPITNGNDQVVMSAETQYVLQINNSQTVNTRAGQSLSLFASDRLAFAGYIYKLDRKFPSYSTWRCELSCALCPGRGKFRSDGHFFVTAKHKHPPDQTYVENQIARFKTMKLIPQSRIEQMKVVNATRRSADNVELKRRNCVESEGIKKLRRNESTGDVIVLSGDESNNEDDTVAENWGTGRTEKGKRMLNR